MKKLLILTGLILFSIFSFSQDLGRKVKLLDNWTFSKDTTVYVSNSFAGNFLLQLECSGLTGTYDGLLKIKQKIAGMDDYIFYGTDSLTSCYSINSANFKQGYVSENFFADTLKIELIQNNITGGTVNLYMNYFYKR